MRELLLYTTVGCHLCEQAEELLAPVLGYVNAAQREKGAEELTLRKVEISDSGNLVSTYGVRIPVIAVAGASIAPGKMSAELGWPFDQAQAFSFLIAQLS